MEITSQYISKSWRILLWLFFLQVFIALVGRSISPLGVIIGEDLALSKTQIGMLPAAFFLGQSLTAIPAGLITDKIGTRIMIIILTACLGLSFVFATFSSGFMTLLFFLALGGAGYGAMQPASNRGILYWFTTKTRGTAMGIKQTGVTVGSALSALILLPLSNNFGWRTTLFAASIWLILFGMITFRFYSDPQVSNKESTDNNKQSKKLFNSIIEVLKHKPLVLVSLSAMGLCSGQMILNTYIVLYAYEQLGFTLILAGTLLVVSEIGGSFGRVIWGIISDRFFNGNRIVVLVIIAVITAVASLVIIFLPAGTPFILVVLVIIIMGFCISGFNGLWMNTASELVPRKRAGAASGVSLTLGTMGVVVGPPVFGYIVDNTGGYTFGWVYLSIVMLIVIAILVYTLNLVKE